VDQFSDRTPSDHASGYEETYSEHGQDAHATTEEETGGTPAHLSDADPGPDPELTLGATYQSVGGRLAGSFTKNNTHRRWLQSAP